MEGTLALDISTRAFGWASERPGRVLYGTRRLNGIAERGKLYAQVRNMLESLIEQHRPRRVIWCRPDFIEVAAVAEAHAGVRHIAELVAYDSGVEAREADTREVRRAVLGRGDFGIWDYRTGSLVPDAGREQAKSAVHGWCASEGYEPGSFEVGNALALLRYQVLLRGKFSGQRFATEWLHSGHPWSDEGEATGAGGGAGALRDGLHAEGDGQCGGLGEAVRDKPDRQSVPCGSAFARDGDGRSGPGKLVEEEARSGP